MMNWSKGKNKKTILKELKKIQKKAMRLGRKYRQLMAVFTYEKVCSAANCIEEAMETDEHFHEDENMYDIVEKLKFLLNQIEENISYNLTSTKVECICKIICECFNEKEAPYDPKNILKLIKYVDENWEELGGKKGLSSRKFAKYWKRFQQNEKNSIEEFIAFLSTKQRFEEIDFQPDFKGSCVSADDDVIIIRIGE